MDKGRFSFVADGDPPESYEVEIDAKGIALDGRRIVRRDRHRCHIYLHRDYPRRPPVVTWRTRVYHPNLLGPERNGGVCLGGWKASEGLDDLVGRLAEMVSYRSFNIEDALDHDAAGWVERFEIRPGFDLDEVMGIDVRDHGDASARIEVRS